MRNISLAQRFRFTVALGLLWAFGFAQTGFAQGPAPTPLPLGLDNNYMVTGDYVVGGWNKTGSTTIGTTPMSTGMIIIPDPVAYATNVPLQQVPPGADIVAAFLYWQSVESSGVHSGQNGSFNGYPISGAVLGNPNAPVSWSSGGCAGASNGSKTIVTYRADVSGLIPLDANGIVQPNATYQVSLPDTGKAGQPPFALGATLVIIYRLLAPGVPLNAVIIYDGSFAPSNTGQTTTQPILGFFQAGNDQQLNGPVVAKITHIVGNGQTNKLQQVFLNNYDLKSGKLVHSTPLPSLYGTSPPFPGNYNTTWDNPTWFANTYPTTPSADSAVMAGESTETTAVVPNSSNKGCVSWGAIVFSATVQDSTLDGLLDVWKANAPNQGYCDPGANRGMSNQGICNVGDTTDPFWVALPGATPGNKDVFIQLDYMCLANPANGTPNCDPANGGISYAPDLSTNDPNAVLPLLMAAFSGKGHGINLHIDPNHHTIPALTCVDTVDANGNPVYCPYPGQAGVVSWKLGHTFLKTQPLNYPDESSCETRTVGGVAGSGPVCLRRFQPGRNNSYHEVIFAVASAVPNWFFQNGTLTGITVSGNMLTLTTLNPHGLAADPGNTGIAKGRVTISGANSNPALNGTYLVQSVPTQNSFTILVANGTTAPTNVTDPFLSVGSGVVVAGSGVSDIGGADSLISLGLWGADGKTVPVEAGTLMHELGHSLGLTHGGYTRTPVGNGYTFNFDANCKPNFQSVMNYLFQVDLLDGVLDYSEEILHSLDESTQSTSVPSVLAGAMHPTTRWYAPNQPIGSHATSHCDGTPLLPGDPFSFRLQGPASSITWSTNQDLNFDGKIETGLQGNSDWAYVDLRQVGATGNDFWASGALPIRTGGGGALPIRTGGGGALPIRTGAGGALPIRTGAGGVGEITVDAANSIVRNPTKASASLMLTPPPSTVNVNFTAPGFGQSQIASFNIYRSANNGPFVLTNFPVTGTPLPLPDPLTFPDTKITCGVSYSYFVTTVLSDGRESVPSNTTDPVLVPCTFVGFLSPLSTAGTIMAPTFSGTVNQGSAVPLKWEILDSNGNPIGDLSTLKLMQACPAMGKMNPPSSSTIPPCVLLYSPTAGAKGNSTFRFSSPQFIFNWDTASTIGTVAGFFTVELTLSDGSAVKATNIQFK